MKPFIFLVLSFLVVPFTMGASLIDKDTKKMVEELNYKIEKLLQYGHTNHAEQMKVSKEQSDLLQRLTVRVESLERRERAAAAAAAKEDSPKDESQVTKETPAIPVATEVAPPAQPVVSPAMNPSVAATSTAPIAPVVSPASAAITAVSAPVTPPPSPVEVAPTTATPAITTPVVALPVEAPKPVVAAPAPAPVPVSLPQAAAKRPEPAKKPGAKTVSKNGLFSFDGVLPYVISVLSVLLMIVLFVRMKRSEQRIKTMLWRADMEALREDLARERKMNPKIHLTGEPNKVHLP